MFSSADTVFTRRVEIVAVTPTERRVLRIDAESVDLEKALALPTTTNFLRLLRFLACREVKLAPQTTRLELTFYKLELHNSRIVPKPHPTVTFNLHACG